MTHRGFDGAAAAEKAVVAGNSETALRSVAGTSKAAALQLDSIATCWPQLALALGSLTHPNAGPPPTQGHKASLGFTHDHDGLVLEHRSGGRGWVDGHVAGVGGAADL